MADLRIGLSELMIDNGSLEIARSDDRTVYK